MDFFKYSKKLLKNKSEPKSHSTNPFKQNKNVTLVWVDEIKDNLPTHWLDSS